MPKAQSSQFPPNTLIDSLFDFQGGMDASTSPLILPKNQLAWGSNLTNRGTLIHPRPARRILTLDFGGNAAVQTAVTTGLYQGGTYYKPDAGPETLVVSISGRLYQFTPIGTTATVQDVTGTNAQSATALQCWLWQAENYVFWNDGINLPVFFDGTNTARSLGPTPTGLSFTSSQPIVIPNIILPPGSVTGVTINLTSNYTGVNGDTIEIANKSVSRLIGTVTAGQGTPIITVTVFATFFFNSVFPSITLPTGTVITISSSSQQAQFPAGRMGAYVMGRVWMALADGKQFIAGDIVGGPSGTKALNFRDAVLNITENNFLVGGGTFTVPGSVGDIRAIIGTATLDASLGQGAVQIFTPTTVFSCNTPVDRLTWQSLTNPILTESAIGNGGLGQYSTFLVNSDTIYRSLDGIRSLILSRQDFNLWVRTPISHEVQRLLARDNQALLPFGTGGFFDNRTLMSCSPVSTPQGVYHQALIALNDDLISTVRDKKPPAYDGAWPGINVFQMMTGEFALVERLYQFCFNTVLQTLELWEHMPESASEVQDNPNPPIIGDNGTQAIQWWFESSSLRFGETVENRTFKSLYNGEIFVDKLVGQVDFAAYYKPDQYPCWIPWIAWSECATQNTGDPTDLTKPQFRPRMGLGTPSANDCDPSTNRPLREGYTYQFKLVVTGQCEFLGARFAAVVIPEPTFAPPSCNALCGQGVPPPPSPLPPIPPTPPPLSALNTDWLARITAAGGARPSDATFAANDTFFAALVAAGIDTKLKICNLFVPDNVIAASTPLIQGSGSAVWTNPDVAWLSSDLTVNGLLRPSADLKRFDTGATPGTFMTPGSGFGFVYVSVDDTSTIQEEYGSAEATGTNDFRLFFHYTDQHTYADIYHQSLEMNTGVRATGAGYMGISRSTTTRSDIYFANSTNPHSSIANSTGTETSTPSILRTISVFANNQDGTPSHYSLKRLSAAGAGTGFSAADSLALYNAVQQFRISIGGGFV